MTTTVLQVGQSASRSRLVTARDIELFTEISGDRNPLHYDADLAARTRFGGIVVQGGVSTAVLNAVVAEDLPGPGSVFLELDLSFRHRCAATHHRQVEVTAARADKPVTDLDVRVVRDEGRGGRGHRRLLHGGSVRDCRRRSLNWHDDRVATRLLERDTELRVLDAALDRAADGSGSVVLVSGRRGSARRAWCARSPDRCVRAGCSPVPATTCSRRALWSAPRRGAARGGPLAAALAADDRGAVFPAVLEELAYPHGPTVLVVEDVHWADSATRTCCATSGGASTTCPRCCC